TAEDAKCRLKQMPQGPWHHGLGDDRARVAAGGRSRTGRHARKDDLARVRPRTPPEYVGRRFLHGRDDLAATALCPLLHRVGQPPRACGRSHGESERAMGQSAGSAVVVDRGRTPGTVTGFSLAIVTRNSPRALTRCFEAIDARSSARHFAPRRRTASRSGALFAQSRPAADSEPTAPRADP